MLWKDVQQFDETNGEHVQALRERCWQGGQVVYAVEKKRGWPPCNVSVLAEAFGCNMSVDERFDFETFHLEVPGGSAYWWRWEQQMEAWWIEGYTQARSEDPGSEEG